MDARDAVEAGDAVDAVVVGSGPNGLAAAITIAQAGRSVVVLEAADELGGGTRSAELTVPGVLHDVCSAVHPLAAASPFLTSLPLGDHGLEWRWPEVDLAHPLDGGRASVMLRSLEATSAALGRDGHAWRRTFGPLAARYDELAGELLRPLLHVPRHPIVLARFGLVGALPATLAARRFRTEEGRALFGGIAAHIIRPFSELATSSAGVVLAAAGHVAGWPVAAGGSRAITAAMASLLAELGGSTRTGVRITSLDQLPPHRVALFDTSPGALVRIAGDRLPTRTRRAFLRWRHGPAAFKLDLAVEGGVPWQAEACHRAGTVHLGGTFEEIAAAEAEVHRGRIAERPYVLVAQQHVCDPQRSAGDVHPVWAYTHVPNGWRGDATEALLAQFERFAPGTRERIVGQHVTSPSMFAADNANYVGGDIAAGANSLRQMLVRPRLALDPYATGLDGVSLCSASTPPGAGAHGMCGYHAARRALRHLDAGRR